jgi:hypothetical protein
VFSAIQAAFRTYAQSQAGQVKVKRYAGVAPVPNANYDSRSVNSATRGTKTKKASAGAGQLIPVDKSGYLGSIANVVRTQAPQLFQRVHCSGGLQAAEEAKFQYFCDQVLGPIHRNEQSRVLIYCPSYLQYVLVRNEILRRQVWVYLCGEDDRKLIFRYVPTRWMLCSSVNTREKVRSVEVEAGSFMGTRRYVCIQGELTSSGTCGTLTHSTVKVF